MSRPRTARPTDIVALVAFDGRVFPNEARPWRHLGRDVESPRLLNSAFEQWFSFATGRATWVSVQGQTVRGVVSAHRRATRAAWEIDTLIAASEDVEGITLSLLDQVVAGAARGGARTLFLRLEAGSDLLPAVYRAGFVSYAREVSLRADTPPAAEALPQPAEMRPHAKGDAFSLYQLYCQSSPPETRAVEAATFQEWLAAEEHRAKGRGHVDLVVENQGRLTAWARTWHESHVQRLDLMVHPDLWPQTEAVLAAALPGLKGGRPVHTLVRSYHDPVRERLEALGFVPTGEYVCLAKRLAQTVPAHRPARVPVPALVKPLIAKPLTPALVNGGHGPQAKHA